MIRTIKHDGLMMTIDRKKDSVKSQRLIDTLIKAKRDNENVTKRELEFVAFGFNLARG